MVRFGRRPRVLFLRFQYFLEPEILAALSGMDVETAVLTPRTEEERTQEGLRPPAPGRGPVLPAGLPALGEPPGPGPGRPHGRDHGPAGRGLGRVVRGQSRAVLARDIGRNRWPGWGPEAQASRAAPASSAATRTTRPASPPWAFPIPTSCPWPATPPASTWMRPWTSPPTRSGTASRPRSSGPPGWTSWPPATKISVFRPRCCGGSRARPGIWAGETFRHMAGPGPASGGQAGLPAEAGADCPANRLAGTKGARGNPQSPVWGHGGQNARLARALGVSGRTPPRVLGRLSGHGCAHAPGRAAPGLLGGQPAVPAGLRAGHPALLPPHRRGPALAPPARRPGRTLAAPPAHRLPRAGPGPLLQAWPG